MLNLSWAERVYQYEVTVGPGGSYDFNTINAAIVDIDNNRAAGESFGQGEREGGTPTAQS